jgi:hypothetical protein
VDWQGLLSLLLGLGEAGVGVASGNPALALSGAGTAAGGGAGLIGGQPGQGNIAGPPSPGMMGSLGQLGSILGQSGPTLSNVGSSLGSLGAGGNIFGGSQFKPLPPLAQPGPLTPFQSSQVPTTGAGGVNPILDLLKKLLGGMQ